MPKKFLTFLVAIFLAAAAPAFAATDVHIKDFNGTSNFYRTLTFNKFNPALGNLNSIYISLTLQTSGGTIIIDNDANSNACGTFEFGANADFSSADVSLGSIPNKIQAYNLLSIILSSNVDDEANDYSPLPPDGNEYNGGFVFDSNSGYVDNSLWGPYLGTGSYDFIVSVSPWSNYTGSGDIKYLINTPASISGNVTIVYDYTIPEPATIALLATGIFALLKRTRPF
ncbi:MAG: choice-of-anchor E domain-containing protein [Phycisphaerae bacterium]|nr:choice-of-anchor E domain-containing protein [Phycisphaerae bacterium]